MAGNAPGGGGGSLGQGRGVPGRGRVERIIPTKGPVAPSPGGGGQVLKPVGYGLKGRPFYDINAYHQSKAYRQGVRSGRIPPQPPQPLVSSVPNQRLSGVNPTFPHTGAPALGGTADEHLEAVRAAMVEARAGGGA